jgi:arylsulfatase A-like enzyme
MKINLFFLLIIVTAFACNSGSNSDSPELSQTDPPNIVYILADDMGYGDVSIYNPESKVNTPGIDSLATQSMRFTDMHAPSSVCTPSRYGILTGDYCWRSRLPQGVLSGYGQPLIEPDQPTVASLLRNNNYTTAVIGKWHLGLGWVVKPGHESALKVSQDNSAGVTMVRDMNPDDIDFTKPPTDGPRTHGFDYSYILPASLDMEPYCYLQNDTLTAPLSATTKGNEVNPRDSPNYATGAFWRPGLMSPDFDFNNVLPHFTEKAVNYIKTQSKSTKPFFLYFAMPSPHTPWLPSKEFVGKSKAGAYGDYVMEVDAMVSRVLDAIEESGKASNTIVIFTSDNGPYWRPQYVEKYNHHAAYIYRGMKADVWEGGHRVPFIVRWPGRIGRNTVSNITATLANLTATCAELVGAEVPAESALDSYSILPVLLQRSDSLSAQKVILNESSNGLFAVRQGDWKLIDGLGSGGFSKPVSEQPKPGEAKGQLYNLRLDPSETKNLYLSEPKRIEELSRAMDSIRKPIE